ncbi:MAG: hypothetical protein E7470_03825 [Ruminococcaceae bacterium]|nr:hypothetical protein [Oscillospiraceae bacterium]
MAKQSDVRYINHYVSGSLAYRQEEKSRRKSNAQLPKLKPNQKIVIPVDPLAMIGIVLAFVLMITMIVSVVHWNQAQKETEALKNYVAALQEENLRLQDTYKSGYDPDEIREIALNMGMIPADQATHIQMQVVVPQVEEQPEGWAAVWAFILGMFA